MHPSICAPSWLGGGKEGRGDVTIACVQVECSQVAPRQEMRLEGEGWRLLRGKARIVPSIDQLPPEIWCRAWDARSRYAVAGGGYPSAWPVAPATRPSPQHSRTATLGH